MGKRCAGLYKMFSGKVGGNWGARDSTTIANVQMQNADVAKGIGTAYSVVFVDADQINYFRITVAKTGFRVVGQTGDTASLSRGRQPSQPPL